MSDSSDRFEQLRASYAQSLASKYSALEGAWHAFATAPDAGLLREVHVLVHRLVGSAPAYGFARIGALARVPDRQIAEWDEASAASRESIDALATALARSMRTLLDALAQAAADAGSPPAS